MEFHRIASIFPLLEGDELQALVDDIRKHGLREPVWLYDGKILDGRNRARACELAGITPTTRTFSGGYLDAVAFVWSENVHRRHLDPGQLAVAEVKRARFCSEYAAEVERMREEARGRQNTAIRERDERGRASPLTQQIGEVVDRHDNETVAVRAKAAGTNRRYLEAAEKLLKTAPERLEPVERGEKTMSQVIREVAREEKQANVAALPTDKFRIIYADPPWSYGNSGSGLDQYGPAERHYPAMTIAELCAMDIRTVTEDNAVLFLWVTSPLLDECWPVIKAWGFEYKTSFVWDKVKHNFGHYNSVRHELLLICTRGSCTPDVPTLIDSVQTIERTERHSEKPEEFRRIIEILYTQGKRLELFARGTHEGWSTWGNECAPAL